VGFDIPEDLGDEEEEGEEEGVEFEHPHAEEDEGGHHPSKDVEGHHPSNEEEGQHEENEEDEVGHEKAPPMGKKKKLVNKFNYSERTTQTRPVIRTVSSHLVLIILNVQEVRGFREYIVI
jgi:hypothetical protein